MKTKPSLNSLVGKKIASISRLRDDQMLQVTFYDGTMWLIRTLDCGEGLENCGVLDWEFDEITEEEA